MAGEAPKVPGSDPVTTQNNGSNKNGNWKQAQYPNPPDPHNPELASLRERWNVPIRQYIRWSSQAWSAAIFVGISFFAVGWFVRGSNPPTSISTSKSNENNDDGHDKPRPISWFFVIWNCVYPQVHPSAECWTCEDALERFLLLFCLLYPASEPSFYLIFFL